MRKGPKILLTYLILVMFLLILTLPSGAVVYEYDDLGRLTTATYTNGQTLTYTYDAGGNLLSVSLTDNSPPTVSVTDPENNASSIRVDKTITVTFNESVVQGSSFNNITLKNDTNGSSVSYTATISEKTLTIDPTSNLGYGNPYVINIPAGAVKDSKDNTLAADYSFHFNTLDSTAAPVITSTNPSDGAENVSVSTPVHVNFNETVVEDVYFDGINMVDTNNQFVVDCNYNLSGDVLNIVPLNNLNQSVTYSVYIPARAVKNSIGNSLESPYTFNFTTGSTPVTTYPNSDPADGATGVAVNKTIGITFKESIVDNVYGDITISHGSTVVSYTYGVTNATLRLDPVDYLECNTAYTVTIPEGSVKYTDGEGLEDDFVFSFTTAAESADRLYSEESIEDFEKGQLAGVQATGDGLSPIVPTVVNQALIYTNGLTKPAGYSASSTYYQDHPSSAFDGAAHETDTSPTKQNRGMWYSTSGSKTNQWLKVDFTYNTFKITKLRFHSARLSQQTRNPKDCIFQGANDGANWTNIYTFTVAAQIGWQEWEFSNQSSYRYYRLFMQNNWGDSYIGVGELQLFETGYIPTGHRITNPIDLSNLETNRYKMEWGETVPDGTSVNVHTAVTNELACSEQVPLISNTIQEDMCYPNTITGSSYTYIESSIDTKQAFELGAVKFLNSVSGNVTLTIKDVSGNVLRGPVTQNGSGWLRFEFTPLHVNNATRYKLCFNVPNGQHYRTGTNYDGVLWKQVSCIFGGSSYSYTPGISLESVDAFYRLSNYPADRHNDLVIYLDGNPTNAYTRSDNDPRIILFNILPAAGTVVNAEYTGVRNPVNWEDQDTGDPIQSLPTGSMAGKHLWIKQNLDSNIPSVIPELHYVHVDGY
ncbi:Ig-like domain-containing protein [Pelotomaculum propionicicum]|uniref:Ig-like domain-containing protein n=1 Tax=Pelotomaculum propionicicum TaxID=258475 RepID=UPI003B783A11